MDDLAKRRRAALLAALLLLAFFLQGALAVRTKSITTDEDSHLSYGQQILEQGTFARRIHQHNATSPWMVVNALPGFVAERLGRELPPPNPLYWSRLPTLLFGLLLGWLVFCWAREAFGPRAGLLALTLCAFCPSLLAHSALTTTDALTTLAIFAAVYAFWRWHAKPSRTRAWIAGVALGLALTAKLSGIYLLPLFLLILAARALAERRLALRPFLSFAAMAALALLVVNAVYLFEGPFTPLAAYQPHSARFQALASTPVLRDLPLPVPTGWVQGMDWVSQDMTRDRWTYCLGRYSPRGFPHYYVVALLTKATLGFLALIALAFVHLAWRRTEPPPNAPNIHLFLLAPVAFYFAYFSFAFHFQIGLRHLLPIFPFLFVFVSRLATERRALAAAAWLLAAAHAASSLHVYPHYLAYFNEAVGGPLHGWKYLIDSNLDWGQDRATVRRVYLPQSPVPVTVNPGGPIAGRLLVSATDLVGLTPGAHQRYAWLREHFEPVDHIGYSWLVYDVTPEDLARCCAAEFWPLPEQAGNLAREGRPIAGAEGFEIRNLERLNDGQLGSNSRLDPAFTAPVSPHPVAAWFGIDWGATPRTLDRLVVYPAFSSRGERAAAFTPLEAVVQIWQDDGWVDVPNTRGPHDGAPRLERRFAPVTTTKVRLWILATRNDRGRARPTGRFRAACLELAAFGPLPETRRGHPLKAAAGMASTDRPTRSVERSASAAATTPPNGSIVGRLLD